MDNAGVLLISMGLALILFIGMYRMFEKAGEPGWACIIPIYNLVVICRIGEVSWWIILLMFIPYVNFFLGLYIYYKFFSKYVTSGIAALGAFIPFIMVPYCGLSNSIVYENY